MSQLLNLSTIVPNSRRINILKEVPIIPDQIPKIKYKIPISLWFVENLWINLIKKLLVCSENWFK